VPHANLPAYAQRAKAHQPQFEDEDDDEYEDDEDR
jgi:hypothetical protein